MPEFVAGTYPYAKRQAIADAVQAGLLPHTQQTEGDVSIRGAVTVIVRWTPPDVVPALDFSIVENKDGA